MKLIIGILAVIILGIYYWWYYQKENWICSHCGYIKRRFLRCPVCKRYIKPEYWIKVKGRKEAKRISREIKEKNLKKKRRRERGC